MCDYFVMCTARGIEMIGRKLKSIAAPSTFAICFFLTIMGEERTIGARTYFCPNKSDVSTRHNIL